MYLEMQPRTTSSTNGLDAVFLEQPRNGFGLPQTSPGMPGATAPNSHLHK